VVYLDQCSETISPGHLYINAIVTFYRKIFPGICKGVPSAHEKNSFFLFRQFTPHVMTIRTDIPMCNVHVLFSNRTTRYREKFK